MQVTVKNLAELVKPAVNVRKHSERQLAEYRRSVEMFGQIRPIIVDENNVIIAGNGLYETMVSMGKQTADCYVVSGLTEKQKKKLMLADNKVFQLGMDDQDAFDSILKELGQDVDIPGFDTEVLKAITANMASVDALIADYGKATQEEVQQYNAAAAQPQPVYQPPVNPYEGYTPPAQQPYVPSYTPEMTPAQPFAPAPQDSSAQTTTMKFVICPKCGEKIWL